MNNPDTQLCLECGKFEMVGSISIVYRNNNWSAHGLCPRCMVKDLEEFKKDVLSRSGLTLEDIMF